MKKQFIVMLLFILLADNMFCQNKEGEVMFSSIIKEIKVYAENIAVVYKKNINLQGNFTWEIEFADDDYSSSLTILFADNDIIGYIYASKKKEYVDMWFIDKFSKSAKENTYGFILDRPDNRTIRIASQFFIYGNKPERGKGLNRVF